MDNLNDIKLPEWISRISADDFTYDLPPEKIAQFPLQQRDRSKLLIYKKGVISETVFSNIDQYLPAGSMMVLNNSRVIKARLFFEKETGARIEIFCLEPSEPSDYSVSMSTTESVEWKCIIGNARKWKSGSIKMRFRCNGRDCMLEAERKGRETGDSWRVKFSWKPEYLSFGEVIESAGHVPLPPYIGREDEKADELSYQTIYSKVDGSVAAPTAGLHFTPEVFSKLENKGIDIRFVTLHAGAGTFKPVKSGNIIGHEMHREYFFADSDLIKGMLETSCPLIAVGTTSVRVLESIYWAGVKIRTFGSCNDDVNISVDQWDPYLLKSSLKPEESFEVLLEWMNKRGYKRLFASTGLLIVPGYEFRIPEVLVTNFHLPGSTLLMLISAWTGPDWKKIYEFALKNDYRFLSYGDSSVLFRK